MRRLSLTVVIASLWLVGITPQASADQGAPACAGNGDPYNAADQVMCWATLDARGDAWCSHEACSREIVALCAKAALDVPAVGHACFLANVRTGNFAGAMALVDYLQEPPAAVTRCQQALSSLAELHVVTNPAGASIEVDDIGYGPAPVTVKLKTPWWEHRIRARFGVGVESTAVDVSAEQLRDVFDTRACALSDLVIAGPSSANLAPARTTTSTPKSEAPAPTLLAPQSAAPATSPASVSGSSSAWLWTLTGAVVTAGGAVAFRLIGDAQYDKVQTQCGPSCTNREVSSSGVKTSDALMVGFAAGSGALLIATVVLAITSGEHQRPDKAEAFFIRGSQLGGSF